LLKQGGVAAPPNLTDPQVSPSWLVFLQRCQADVDSVPAEQLPDPRQLVVFARRSEQLTSPVWIRSPMVATAMSESFPFVWYCQISRFGL
jgi:hypothetical protein